MAIIAFMKSASNDEIEEDIDKWAKVARIITAKVDRIKMTADEYIAKRAARYKHENKVIGGFALKSMFNKFIVPRFPNEIFDNTNISEAPDSRYMADIEYNSTSSAKIRMIYWYRMPEQYPGIVKVIVNDEVIVNKETNEFEPVVKDDSDDDD